jgi:hypothetical protein
MDGRGPRLRGRRLLAPGRGIRDFGPRPRRRGSGYLVPLDGINPTVRARVQVQNDKAKRRPLTHPDQDQGIVDDGTSTCLPTLTAERPCVD